MRGFPPFSHSWLRVRRGEGREGGLQLRFALRWDLSISEAERRAAMAEARRRAAFFDEELQQQRARLGRHRKGSGEELPPALLACDVLEQKAPGSYKLNFGCSTFCCHAFALTWYQVGPRGDCPGDCLTSVSLLSKPQAFDTSWPYRLAYPNSEQRSGRSVLSLRKVLLPPQRRAHEFLSVRTG